VSTGSRLSRNPCVPHSDAASAEHAQLNERKIDSIDLYIAGGPVIAGVIPVVILI
jgi:hypothetical protein